MEVKEAAIKGYQVYTMALRRIKDESEAYVKGLDFIIDKIYQDAELTDTTMKAIEAYDKQFKAA